MISTNQSDVKWIRLDNVEICAHKDAQYLQTFDANLSGRRELLKATAITQSGTSVTWLENSPKETPSFLRSKEGCNTYLQIGSADLLSEEDRIENYSKPLTQRSFAELDKKHASFRTYQQLVEFVEKREKQKKRLLQHHLRLVDMINSAGCDLTQLFLNLYDIAWPLKPPTITKSRLIKNPGGNVLLPLEDVYEYSHFGWALNDSMKFEEKLGAAVWRGANSGPFFDLSTKRPNRRELVSRFSNDPRHDIGLAYANYEDKKNVIGAETLKSWVKGPLTAEEQLNYKYILIVEGNDMATNLPWVFLSNSLPIMPSPWVETWKLESFIKPYVHFIPVADNFSDLDNVVDWCENNADTCKRIADQSKIFGLQFFDTVREKRISSQVLKLYSECMREGEG